MTSSASRPRCLVRLGARPHPPVTLSVVTVNLPHSDIRARVLLVMAGAYVRARCFVADWKNRRSHGSHHVHETSATGNDAPASPAVVSTRATAGIAVSTRYGQQLAIPTPGSGGGYLVRRGDVPLADIQLVYRREVDVPPTSATAGYMAA